MAVSILLVVQANEKEQRANLILDDNNIIRQSYWNEVVLVDFITSKHSNLAGINQTVHGYGNIGFIDGTDNYLIQCKTSLPDNSPPNVNDYCCREGFVNWFVKYDVDKVVWTNITKTLGNCTW